MTVDLDQELVLELKVKAAREGRKIKDVLNDLVRLAMRKERVKKTAIAKRRPIPMLKSKHPAPPGQEMTPERIAEVLWGSGDM